MYMENKYRLYFIYENGVCNVFTNPKDMYAEKIKSDYRLKYKRFDYV